MFNCKELFKLQIRPPTLILLIAASQDRLIFPSQKLRSEKFGNNNNNNNNNLGERWLAYSSHGGTHNCKAVSHNLFPSHKIPYNTCNLQNPLKSAMAYTWSAGLLSLLFQRKGSYNLICIGYNSHGLWFKCTIKGNIHSRQNPITKLLFEQHFLTSLDLRYWISQEWKVSLL